MDAKPSRLGVAWLCMCGALALHVTDEALTGFLDIYNPTVLALKAKFGFFPIPVFEFREWLTGLIVGICALAALTPLASRGVRWVRPIFYFTAVAFGILNAVGHTTETIVGHTLETIRFPRPAPGFYSSPVLVAAAIYLLVQLRRASPVSPARPM